MKRIFEHLFYNPFSSAGFTAQAAGLSLSRTCQLLGEGRGILGQRVPLRRAPYHQLLYCLDEPAQLRSMGRTRSPQDLCQAFLMAGGRLEGVRRQILPRIMQAHPGAWTISPWRIGSSRIFVDALLCLGTGDGRAFLLAVASAAGKYSYTWYEDLASAWADWRAAQRFSIPSVLLVPDEASGEIAASILAGYPLRGNGGVRLGFGAPDGRLYAELQPQATGLLQAEFFIRNSRRSQRPGARRGVPPLSWAAHNLETPLGRAALLLGQLSKRSLLALEQAARYPSLSAEMHAELADGLLARREVPGILQSLAGCGALERVELAAGQENYLISLLGLSLLGGMQGVDALLVNRYLGYPLREDRFFGQQAHITASSQFMVCLASEGVLPSWRTSYLSFSYGFGKAHRFRINPDGAGFLDVNGHLRYFWLELDRGTRRGKRVREQLGKYFLAERAACADHPLPLILFLVSDARGYTRSRTHFLEKVILSLAREFETDLWMAFADMAAFLSAPKGQRLTQPLWDVFGGGDFLPGQHSLAALDRMLGAVGP